MFWNFLHTFGKRTNWLFYIGTLLLALQAPASFAQVNANFTAVNRSGCSPLTVQFTNLSTGPITTYQWDFGNGNTSTLPNPGVIYVASGTYTVSLTVSDGAGSSSTHTETNFITVFEDPQVDFTSDNAAGCAPLSVNFSDLTAPGDAPITSWIWDFGDGNVSIQQNPNHTYATAGSYDVTLVVQDANGCSSSLIMSDFISVTGIATADFSATPNLGCAAPHAVTFTSSVSPIGNYSYLWDFGDGTTASTANPSHTYTIDGDYTVSMTVFDPNGCAVSVTKTDLIQIHDPIADFSILDTEVCVGQTVIFTNLTTGADTYQWQFGDGNTSNGTNPSHSYVAPGIYNVQLTATNSALGCSDILVRNALITVHPNPSANFSSPNRTGCAAPMSVDFVDGSTGAIAWLWDFGNGLTSTAQNPTTTYTTPGYFDVSLTITDANGCQATETRPSYVELLQPTADFVATPITGCIPLTVNFLDISNSTDPIVSWIWNFGDGNSSVSQNPSHTYTVSGLYPVQLIVITQSGCRDTLFSPDHIAVGTRPLVDFNANPRIVCVEDPVTFIDQSNQGFVWFWSFGDGGTSALQNPVYQYSDTGTFDVTLIVNNLGCLDTLTRDSFIQVVGPIADFILTPAQGCDPPLDVTFFDQSINANGWFWDFGDGNTSTLQNPTHTYTTVGNYTITLVVTDSVSGCSDDFTSPVVITDPQANFSATPTFGCIGLAVPFTNNSTDANTYQWDFGDGNTSPAANPSHIYATPGTYDVTLIASDGTCTDTLVRNAFIQIAGPDVDFVADTFNGCAPFTVSFTDLSVAPSGAAITNWFWDFGDGGISNTMNPSYTYNTAGIFDVTLQVIDSDGCTSSITKTGYVNPTFPTAEFTSNDTISCPGALISFISQASGVGITHLWDFGDGTFSNAINPVHIFPANNSYAVTLTVTDINGCQDVTAKAGFITVGQPTANFTADNTTATCPPLTVNFSDLSSANVTQWLWEFGDGSTSTLRNPSKVYARAGLFDVTLIVTTAQGCRDTMFLDDFIQLDGPDGSFTFTPNEGCNPTDVTFTGSGVDVVNWTWDFGDGSLGFGQTVTHTYVTDTTARPVMLIEDINGCQVAITTDDSIIIRPLPQPDFTVDYTNICLGQIASFTNTSLSERPVIAYFWDFGDGGTSTQVNPQHTYIAAGTYLVTLALTTVDGCIDSVATPITITVTAPPTANFIPSQIANCTPLSVSFTEASTGVFPLVSWEWDFDDGTTFTGQFPPAHTFTTPGVYNVSLTVIDTEGCQSTVSRALTAHPLPPVDFSASTRVGCSPINIQFTDDTNGASPAAQWFWDFGDGSSTSTQQNPIHNYSADGNYTVKLIVVDANGCIDSLTRINYIRLNHPIADFSTDAAASCPPQLVSFRDQSVADTTLTWLWDFGDGNSSTQQNPSHVYTLPGTYDITLTVTNILGCSDTYIMPAEIENYTPPTAVMSVSVTDACLPATIVGTNSSTPGGTPIVGYIWNNGQGSNQTTPNSSYLYNTAGTYQMSLIAIDANGCRDTATQAITINPNPVANFVADDSISCAVANIAFTNLSTGAFPQVSWEWEFGDGNTGSSTNPTHTYLNDGAYTVSLKVTDVNGCQDSLTKVNYINLDHPEADFAPITTTACPGQGIAFTDLSSGPATLTGWFWDFGDGNSTTSAAPVHTYANPGTYTVTLTITDAEGCSDTEIKAALITVTTPPTTSFIADVTSGCTPLIVNFTDTSTPNSAALVSRLWDFGDGSGSTAPAPAHTFTTAGIYTVTLTTTDANGCSDQFQMQVEALSLANVDFVANTRWSCAPTSIDFTDLTTTPFLIVSWAWDFGDGTTSTQQSPTHTYTADGVYTVTLTITDQNGCVSTTSKPNYINLSHPIADFTFDNAIVCPNLPIGVTFTDASTADTTISTWLWDFGDGTTSNLQNPSHSYSTSGTYSVTLTITNVLNCGDSETKAASIQVRNAPTTAFSVNQAAGCTPLEVSFTDLSTPGDAPIVNWDWDFGDGTTSLLPDPIHTFTTPGTYLVSLTTTDANGCEHTATQSIESYTLPVANFVSNQRYSCAPTAINFTDLTTGITPIVSWTWDFGDGNTASVQNPSHTYTADGTYDVQLIVENANGCRDTMLRSQYIRLTHPVADFTLSTAIVCRDVAVQFTDISTPDTTLMSWLWDFGDGNTSTQQNPSYIYTVPGTYTVSLSITNVLNCGDTEVKAGIIEVLPAPTTLFGVIDTSGCAPFTAAFTDLSSPNGSAIIDWSWDFGDGTTSLVQSPTHTFVTPGIYPVTLTTTDANGCVSSYSQNMEAFTLPTADFATLQRVGCAAADITFTDLSTPGSGLINGWAWNFGDGGTSNVKNPTYTYTADGTYDVQLTVTDANGCTATLTRTAYIRLTHPQAAFTYAPGQICVGSSVNFTDTSIPDTTLNSWLWDFGDGTTSTQQNPAHVYTVAGTYSVSLTVTNVLNCSDSETLVNIIEVYPGPTTLFGVVDTSGCAPFTAAFTDLSSPNGSAIIDWSWDFGDGTTSLVQSPAHTFVAPGVYPVTLTTTDANGCVSSYSQNMEAFTLPTADFATLQRVGCAAADITFTDLSTPGSGLINGWAWDFGDGGTSNVKNPTYTYTADGTYDVQLTVTDANGCTATLIRTAYIRLTHPQAAFTYAPGQICVGSSVNFTDTSIPDTTLNSWFWDFGDGTTSTQQNPAHVYSVAGTYSVSLTVTNVLNCSDVETQVNIIEVQPGPTAGFTPSVANGCTPLNVSFTDASTISGAAIVNWQWDFANGNTHTGANPPSQTYTTPGIYPVSLTVTDVNGCSQTFTQDIESFVLPVADFQANQRYACSGVAIAFSDLTTGPVPAVNWAWDFGDGTSSTLQNPTHTYTANGNYDVELVVIDQNGCTHTVSKTNYIQLTSPQAAFSISDPTGCTGLAVTFSDTSVPDTTLATWLWDFGDGTTSTLQNPNHIYNTPGTYSVTLTITNVVNCSDTEIQVNAVTIFPSPTTSFTVANNQGCAPFDPQFTDASAGISSAIVDWEWDFGNGDVSNLQNPGYVYPQPGTYLAVLTTTDANGCSSSFDMDITVFDLPTANFFTNTTAGCSPLPVTFNDVSNGPAPIVAWEWNFGDGSTANVQNPTYTYLASGDYTVTLVAFDVNGCLDTMVRTEYIHLSRPTAEFTLTPGVGCPGQDIGFTDLSIPDTTLTDWFWTFGDGTNSTLQNPSHSYANPGTYTVSLTVTNVLGCVHTETKIDTIVINTPPTAQFSATPPQGCAPHQLNFADLSTGAGVAITGWTWDFGDGNVSSLQNPTHTYPAPGLYTVSLTAVDANGCDATVTETVEVFDLPTADFRTNTRVGCAPTAITFFDNSTGPVAVTRWVWNFGDGSVATIQNPTHTYAADGTYDVELIIFDANGCSDTLLRSAYINLRHPVANFSLTPVSGCPGTEVFFTDTSTPDTTLSTWFWDFGDGTNAATQNPSHVYAAPGFYTVSLTITNILGCSDTRTLVDTVEIITGPTADFAPAAPQGCTPFTTIFANLSAPGGAALVSYRWEFGDGQTSVVPNPTHTFTVPGTYDVVLYTTDLSGCVDSVTHPVTALDYPTADFSSSTRVGCSPTAINFFDLSNSTFSVVGWLWDFGDGNTSTLQFPTHTYAADGTYQVSLTITDAFGCQQTVVRPQYIRLSHPVADFTVSDTIACVGIHIDFQDASIADTTLQTWTWDFGDGTTSTLQNPSHAYAGPGMYSVTLTIENVLGCTDAITQTNLIEITSGPTADFTPSTLAACTPVSVNFTNTSTGASSPIISYEWDFGNGNTSNFQNDATIYTTPGIYSISLIATDALGCQDTIVKQVEARPIPVPVFDASDSTGCAPTTVNFRAQAPGGGSISTWAWNFGDGNNGTGQFPSHVYAADGVYDVTLTVVDQFGCTGTLTKPQYIRLSHPQANFVPDQTLGCEGMIVRFTDTSIPDTTITDWDWTFGDGQTGTGPNPSHAYANAGTYTVGLTITNIFGCQDTYTLTNGLTILPGPGAVFTASSTIGCMPLDVQFTDASVPNGQGIVTWEWDFGDGGTASSINPNHLFTTAGIFTVQLVVTDNSGCADTTTRDITIHATPQANFFSPDTVGCAANPIRFFDLSSGSATLTNWDWSFGDGSSSTQQHPTHVYAGEGAYTIQLVVTDLNGCTDTLTRVQYVRLTSPDAAFTSVEPLGCPGLTVEFTDTSIPDTTLTSWFWEFGDGTTSTQVNPIHVFPAAGTYSVALTVTNVLGCSNTETVNTAVDISFPPTAQFTFDPVGCLPYNVQFSDASTSNSAPIVSWLWDLGTGDTSILRNPTYTYTQAGTYTISLTVTDANGCSDQLSQNFIQVARPQADFMVSQRVGCAPETINFTDLSIPTLPIMDWLWDFGDGNTSTLQHPTHTYSADGSYTIRLIVTDANGCQDSLTRVNYIRLTHPIADFASLPVSGCIGTSVTFSDQSIPDTTITSWLWDFGDGNTSTQQNPTYLYTTAGQFDVSLTVTNVLGCSHTSTQPGFINIWLPPTALFTASSLSVCAPGLVDFTDVSTSNFGITNWEWTVDGTVHAASQNMSYFFTAPGNVEISLVITDLNGCTDTFRQTVEVHQPPTAGFTASDTLGCAPATIVFSDLTTPTPASWFWTFGDGTTSSQQNPVHTYGFNGEYTVSLVVEDQNGCRDSVIKPDFIRLDNPRADFQLTYDEGCIPITANFVADVTSGNGISNWFWDFGDGFTGSGETISHEYGTAGLFTVTLVVIDSGGCRDTARQVHVIDAIEDLLPDPIEIYAASVISDDAVQLFFPKFSGNNFSHYSIYREVPGQGFQLIDTLDYINDTIYVDTGTGIGGLNCLDESYCYKVIATNSCGTEGLLNQAQQHCTIELTATPVPGRMLLNWNRYVGWNVEMYEVYRVSSYNPITAQFLGFVDGNTTTYRDSATECFNDYTYRIRAIGQQNLQEAWSDTSFAINTSGLPAEPGEVVRATVENNREILVEWDAFNPEQVSVIYLERSEDDALTWRTLATMPPGEIKYIDNTVQVNRQSYVYRISAQDSCGSVTPVSNIGKTILLNVDRPNGWNRLDWSAYEEWRFGVDHYEIEVFSDSAGVWVLVDIVDGSVLEYEDTQTDLNQGEYCYRVRAHELGNNNARSMSNEVCVPVEHDLFAPNAFTPNGDGVNDLFLLQGIHVREFTIQVFSRWGMKVYESSNLEEGWDGTYLGQKVPEGAYVFVAKGKGFSGRPFVLNGTITLIR